MNMSSKLIDESSGIHNDWRSDWQDTLNQVYKRPAMYIGSRENGHLMAIEACLRLIQEAHAFERVHSISLQLSPHQFIFSVSGGALKSEIESFIDWHKSEVLAQALAQPGVKLREVLYSKPKSRFVGWKKCFSSASGPDLFRPIAPFWLADLFYVAIKTSSGTWSQLYRSGWPVMSPEFLRTDESYSLLIAGFLSPKWFSGLPYTTSDLESFKSSVSISSSMQWHSEDDLFTEASFLPQLITSLSFRK